VTLLAFNADRGAAVRAMLLRRRPCSSRYLLLAGPTAANPPHVAAAAHNETDRQTDTVSLHRPCQYCQKSGDASYMIKHHDGSLIYNAYSNQLLSVNVVAEN